MFAAGLNQLNSNKVNSMWDLYLEGVDEPVKTLNISFVKVGCAIIYKGRLHTVSKIVPRF